MSSDKKEEVYEKTKREVLTLLKSTIRPEFLNRIDEVIVFKPLDRDEIKEIVMIQFRMLQNLLAKNRITITITDPAVDYIADAGFDPQFGARPIKRVIQRNLMNELSKMILAGEVNRESEIEIDFRDGKLLFKNK
jgi:ATP-dependent Clp protease ATP-binding subunit ClpB